MNPRIKSLAPAAFIALWGLLMLAGLTAFPVVYSDEVEYGNHALNFAARGEIAYSLYDDIYPKNFYSYRHVWPPIIRPFYVWVLGGFFSTAHVSVGIARFPSLLCGIGILVLFGWFSRRLFTTSYERHLTILLLMGQAYFVMTSHFVRPEIFLSFAGFLSFILFYKGTQNNRDMWMFFSGLLGALSIGLHTNGVVVLGSLCFLWLPYLGWRLFRERHFYVFSIGAMLGVLIYLQFADFDRFLPGTKFLFFNEFNTPPIFNSLDLITILGNELSRYYRPWVFWAPRFGTLWEQSQGIWWSLFFYCLCTAFWRHRFKASPNVSHLIVWFGAFLVVFLALFVGYKAPSYSVLLLPFSVLIVAQEIKRSWTKGTHPWGWKGLMTLGVALLLWPAGTTPYLVPVLLILIYGIGQMRRANKSLRNVSIFSLLLATCFLWGAPQLIKGSIVKMQQNALSQWPLLAIGLGLVIFCTRQGKNAKEREAWSRTSLTILPVYLCGLFLIGSGIFLASQHLKRPSYHDIVSQLRPHIPKGAKVAGPMTLWLSFSDTDYRDIGGLEWHRFLNGDKNVSRHLADFSPSFLILDQRMARRFYNENVQRRVLGKENQTPFLPMKNTLLASIPTSLDYGKHLYLIKVDEKWPS